MAHVNAPSGQLRIAAPPLLGEKWVLPVLLPLTRRWQGLGLDLRLSTQRVDLAADGIDLAIRIGAPGHHVDLTAHLLGHQALLLCASPALLLKAMFFIVLMISPTFLTSRCWSRGALNLG